MPVTEASATLEELRALHRPVLARALLCLAFGLLTVFWQPSNYWSWGDPGLSAVTWAVGLFMIAHGAVLLWLHRSLAAPLAEGPERSAIQSFAVLYALGGAVAKISHDLRNILTTAQIFADRLEDSADPKVRRAAPKLVNSITRAVNLCETTLAFGKAEEPQPTMSIFNLAPLVADVVEAETLAAEAAGLARSRVLGDSGWFDMGEIARVADAHRSGREEHGRTLWQFVMLERSLRRLFA